MLEVRLKGLQVEKITISRKPYFGDEPYSLLNILNLIGNI